ncbi:Sulfite exporter TauE/SafE [Piscirickettsia salmonis]|uniref:sulfite exporter TauE/SafE family protein n=1 Tax=Piscirickettsia salmonis TaxID=1238 RepID=UPI001E62166B|nr:sulfite exporter TauE/SafE family protein [Piscirickettsia salmonis]QGP51865.1 Sulfite exporter TauE/SafE [Piscirickettsia salmonis]QGP52891.1 Sulfite exporter TauE/SafE [Piscirickettsia salmonis]QGP61184.1 Sulfite exporter TauE/SafE [Piscirickettsia salmonis]QGP62463.1 Sulfite exporter TauE/SafE [Piscirickettsia salmonis]
MFCNILNLIVIGAGIGFLSGLLGSGGTTFLIPVLTAFFTYIIALHSASVHFAVFTALAISALTSLSSMAAYVKQKLIKNNHVCSIIPALLAANIVGLCCAIKIPELISTILFAIFLLYLSYSIFFDKKQGIIMRYLPLMSGWVGFQSGLLGISGGSIAFSYLAKMPMEFEQSTALSTLITFSISLIGLIIGLCSYSSIKIAWATGFIYWPAVVLVTPVSSIMARLGMRTAKVLPLLLLKLIFALMMLSAALYMLSSVI